MRDIAGQNSCNNTREVKENRLYIYRGNDKNVIFIGNGNVFVNAPYFDG